MAGALSHLTQKLDCAIAMNYNLAGTHMIIRLDFADCNHKIVFYIDIFGKRKAWFLPIKIHSKIAWRISRTQQCYWRLRRKIRQGKAQRDIAANQVHKEE